MWNILSETIYASEIEFSEWCEVVAYNIFSAIPDIESYMPTYLAGTWVTYL